jgi:predicted nuclease of predicted toxin-antitoxin system
MMKILLDMNISPEWLSYLRLEGWECAHWSEIGEIGASDEEIFSWAARNDFIVFTHDLDFSAILAASKAIKPSVVQIRVQNILPEFNGARLVSILSLHAEQLAEGAIVTIEPSQSKVRILPLR